MNQNIFKDRWLFPMTEPDGVGKQRKLTIEPSIFKNTGECEGLNICYSFGKGEGLYFVAPRKTMIAIAHVLREVLESKERKDAVVFTAQPNPNRPEVKLAVGRGEDLLPFIALSGNVNGQQRTKKFFFYPPKGFQILRGGQPIPDLEMADRMAKVFLEDVDLFLRWLEDSYKAREFNPSGGRGGPSGGDGSSAASSDFDSLF